MLCMHPESRDPFFNLAAEEYLLRNSAEEYFMLWQSDPVVVVGKHQNTLAEVNYRFIREKGIPVVRRLTGGGTVYHDPGNINFTFIRKGDPGQLVDFAGFIAPVIDFLGKSGIEAVQGPKHEIMVSGKKISGNAEHVFKNRVLHHGTLLHSADLDNLQGSIRPRDSKYIDKAVQSNRSSVMNLRECLDPGTEIRGFMDDFFRDMISRFNGTLYSPGKEESNAIRELAFHKYRSWEWVFGWSPDYTFFNEFRKTGTVMDIELSTHRGIITRCRLQSENFSRDGMDRLSRSLTGTPHEEDHIREKLMTCGIAGDMDSRDLPDLVFAFFG